ncbi:Pentatricopeptide repeat-containing protein [Apostasia shenzhenica]|uniref:Pentatricopeptide repeat-containing protein n=1 Tax=Apostasia shenzhenica TaxID=1088818 RepID=A0A2I0A0R0_9ASPA|nr:Pentatricopeptide repeat-containing protein [Apostasia shenzhenica]
MKLLPKFQTLPSADGSHQMRIYSMVGTSPRTLTPRAVDSILRSLSASPSTVAAAHVHLKLLVRGLLRPSSSSDYFTTKLLQLYADAGDLPAALHLFDELPQPNIFAWTAVIAYHSRSGDRRRCYATYERMRAVGVAPDSYVLPVVLRSTPCYFAALHADSIKFAASGNVQVSNALICAYSDSGDAGAARRVFDSMDSRDLLSWNSMISAYAYSGCTDSALALFRSMGSNGYDPDRVTWNTLIDGYCRAGRCAEALELFDQVVDRDVVTWTTIIVGHAYCANHEAALGLFRRMTSCSDVPPDQHTLSCVVACCRHVGSLRAGREVHASGIKTLEPAAFYFSAGAALVALYASSKCITAANEVIRLADSMDRMNWNALIVGLTHAGLNCQALDRFRVMQSRGIGTDATTLASVLPACSLAHGQQIHAHTIKNYCHPAAVVCNALISTYARGGCIAAARSVFSAARFSGDVVTWNAMIAAYGSHGLVGPIMGLVSEMAHNGPRPNLSTLTSLLTACSHTGLVDDGLEWFNRFQADMGLEPEMAQFGCVVDMLGRAGRFEEAIGFVRRMREAPAASVWGALMAASRAHRNVEVGEMVFEKLVKIEPENAGNYVTMAEIYASAGRWEDAKMVREMIDWKRVVKPSGYSWAVGK